MTHTSAASLTKKYHIAEVKHHPCATRTNITCHSVLNRTFPCKNIDVRMVVPCGGVATDRDTKGEFRQTCLVVVRPEISL